MKTPVAPLLPAGRRINTEYWLIVACGLVLLGAALVGWWLSWLSASTAAFCFLLLAALVARSSRTRSLRIADLVTLTRGLGICFLAGFALQALTGGLAENGILIMIIMGTLCLTLDGVDGWVARARGEASAFGARFDVETDAAMLIVLSVAVAALGIAGWWVLAIGAMRYAYVATSLVVPALRTPLPYHYSGKVIAVLQAVALLAALAYGLTHGAHWVPTTFLLAALALLCWSFGRSVIWQLRQS
ncbi:MAG TPA: CDP-alcohol phosphatidyltransferase family protein [Propionibacteriaceae bacterium]|nr:CDP-alcohol phosphatidyltransferase family protein [Propionibacteriaceae bacterium]